jgi:hypothetical protein
VFLRLDRLTEIEHGRLAYTPTFGADVQRPRRLGRAALEG